MAGLLSKACHNMGTELQMQLMTSEQLTHRTANQEDGARLDDVAESFWGNDRQSTLFDVRVFNPFAPSYRNTFVA